MAEAIAVTVVGGYLGAGKTTLVNHVLATSDERMAVLVNDFGDIGIDADLVASHGGDTVTLANGCICCTLADGFASALATIAAHDPRPERLVIEASGVSDPAQVAAYGHAGGYRLDAVVVLADAETLEARSADRYVGDTVLGQLAAADIVVLNKVDLVPPARARAARSWLEARCPEAVVVDAVRAVVDPAVLFGEVRGRDAAGAGGDHAHGAHASGVFESWAVVREDPVERAAVERLMAGLPAAVARAKGIVWLADDPGRRFVLQRVGGRWSLRPDRDWGPDQPGTRVELIGLVGSVDPAWLAATLR